MGGEGQERRCLGCAITQLTPSAVPRCPVFPQGCSDKSCQDEDPCSSGLRVCVHNSGMINPGPGGLGCADQRPSDKMTSLGTQGEQGIVCSKQAHAVSPGLQGDLGLLVTGIRDPRHEAEMFFLHFYPLYLSHFLGETNLHAVTELGPIETKLTLPGDAWIWFEPAPAPRLLGRPLWPLSL